MISLVIASVVALILTAIVRSRSKLLVIVAAPGLILIVMSWLVLFLGDGITDTQVASPGGTVWLTVDMQESAELGALAGSMLVIGATLAALLTPKVTGGSLMANLRLNPQSIKAGRLFALAVLLTLAYVVVYGPSQLYDRPTYGVTYAVPQLASVSGLLIPAGFGLAVMVCVASKRLRGAAVSLILVQAIVLFCTASRMLGVLPLLGIAVIIILGVRPKWWGYVLAVGLALAGSVIALKTRGSAVGHGFAHYVGVLATIRPSTLGDAAMDSLSNILFSVPLIKFVEENGQVTVGDLLTSANPNFASDAGWAKLSEKLRVHEFVPYNGLGELASVSVVAMCVGCVLIALVAGLVASNLSAARSHAALLLALTFYFVSFILLLQYNLRSSFRMIYAAIALSLLAFVLRKRAGPAPASGVIEPPETVALPPKGPKPATRSQWQR